MAVTSPATMHLAPNSISQGATRAAGRPPPTVHPAPAMLQVSPEVQVQVSPRWSAAASGTPSAAVAAPTSPSSGATAKAGGRLSASTALSCLHTPLAAERHPLIQRASPVGETMAVEALEGQRALCPPTSGSIEGSPDTASACEQPFSPPTRGGSSSSTGSSPTRAPPGVQRFSPPVCQTPNPEQLSPGVRFMSSVQELRYLPPSPKAAAEEEATRRSHRRAASWRATTTPEGDQYFYNTTTGETCWEPPSDPRVAAGSASKGLRVGMTVRVFSNTHQLWCDGYVERVSRGAPERRDSVTVAFKSPVAQAAEWVKKELSVGHKDLWCSSVCGAIADEEEHSPQLPAPPPSRSGGFQSTSLPTDFTPEELACYDELFARAASPRTASDEAPPAPAGLGPDGAAAFLKSSGLPNRALKEVWQASNPDLKAELGIKEFRTVCRLVAHCQELLASGDPASEKLVKVGGGALRGRLRSPDCAAAPPPRLPTFKRDEGACSG